MANEIHRAPVNRRRVSRRAVLGGALAAGSVAVAYAALGDKFSLFSGGNADEDAAAIKKDSVKVSHLLRRTGFGVSRDEYDGYQSMGLQATLDELINFTTVNDDEAVQLANAVLEGPNRNNPVPWWLIRMANTKRPLQEKMTFFWHGLLTSQLSVVRDPQGMIDQNEFFRTHVFDTFPTILRGITMDPAMMVYLNVDGSQRSAPNENYARELMELYSLGEGNYTEQDVREAARAFTGWQVPRSPMGGGLARVGTPVLRQDRFDSGSKTFLGKTGNFRPDDIVDIITQQPAAPEYITRRLFEYFIYDDATKEDVAPFVAVYKKNDGSIGAVVDAMLRSDVFYSPRAYKSLVKSPLEYVISAIKALSAQATVTALVLGERPRGNGGVLNDMGQVPFEPPNVAGWPGGASWLNSSTMLARLNFINSLTGGPRNVPRAQAARPDAPPPAPRPEAPALGSSEFGTASQALAHYLPLAVDDNLPAESRQVLIDYGGGLEARLSPEQLRGLAYLVLASPQFHLS